MHNFKTFIKSRLSERADVVQTILMLPIAIIILFAMINLSSYFSVRADVQNAAKNGARLVALYGGNGTGAIKNNTGKTVNQIVLENISPGGKCAFSYCSAPPRVSCTPNVVQLAGDPVSCTVTYDYSPIAPVWKGLNGLNGVFGTMRVTSASVSETGVNGG